MKRIALCILLCAPVSLTQQDKPQFQVEDLPETSAAIEIRQQGQTVVTIGMDGKVTYGKGFTADTASKIFWEQLGKEYPEVCKLRKP